MSELGKRYEELLALPTKWLERVEGVKRVEGEAKEAGLQGVADMLRCIHLEQKRCADELQTFLDSLPALKKEWERAARLDDERAWLIESGCGFLSINDYHQTYWTFDSLKAVRFSRRDDAEKVLFALNLEGLERCHVTEHIWVNK